MRLASKGPLCAESAGAATALPLKDNDLTIGKGQACAGSKGEKRHHRYCLYSRSGLLLFADRCRDPICGDGGADLYGAVCPLHAANRHHQCHFAADARAGPTAHPVFDAANCPRSFDHHFHLFGFYEPESGAGRRIHRHFDDDPLGGDDFGGGSVGRTPASLQLDFCHRGLYRHVVHCKAGCGRLRRLGLGCHMAAGLSGQQLHVPIVEQLSRAQ